MTVSMRVMSAGDGYKYLQRTLTAADGDRELSTPLTRYYAERAPRRDTKVAPSASVFWRRFSVLYVVVPSSALLRLLDELAVLYQSRRMMTRPIIRRADASGQSLLRC